MRAWLRKARGLVFAGVPSLSADALGLFRVVWGLALIWVLVGFSPEAAPDPPTRDYKWWGSWDWLDSLASNTGHVNAVKTATVIALGFFVIGLFSRLAYAVAATGFTVYLLAIAEWTEAGHEWMPLSVVVPLLVFVRWGDGFSLDETIRRLRGRGLPARPAGPGYGMAIWLPGLCLGLAWLSACHAKISTYGSLEWATSGAVQYHWVIDAPSAPSDLGAFLASQEHLAVFFSFSGLALEAFVITHIFFRSQFVRALYLIPALSLVGGFWLFQGVFWTPWWTLLLALLPWQPIYDTLARALPVAVAVVDPDDKSGVARARLVHALDWMNRVGFESAPSEEIAVVDPETGTTYNGRAGWARLARSVPLLWPAVLTFSLPGVLRLGERFAGRRPALPRWAGAAGPVRSVSIVGALLAVAVVVAQGAATRAGTEQPPFFSDFPMYSITYPSREYFDDLAARSFDDYDLIAEIPGGGTQNVRDRLGEDGASTLEDVADAAYNDREGAGTNSVPVREEMLPDLKQLRAEYRKKYGDQLGPIQVVSINRPFLWDRHQFADTERRVLVATVGTDEVTVNVAPDGVEAPQEQARR